MNEEAYKIAKQELGLETEQNGQWQWLLFPDNHVVPDPGGGGFTEGGYQVGNRGRYSAVGVNLKRHRLWEGESGRAQGDVGHGREG